MKVRHDGGVVTRIGPEPRVSMREGCWRSVGRGAHRPAIDVQRVHRTHAMVQGLPGCFDQHAPRVVPALFGYPAALRRTVARLIDAWVQTEISDKLLRSFEANNRTDGCGQSECHHHIDTRDRHQALDILARQSGLSKFALYYPQVLTQAVVPRDTQMPLHRVPFIERQALGGEPAPPRFPNRSACGHRGSK